MMTSFSAPRVSSSTSARRTDAVAVTIGAGGVSVTTTSGAQVSGERLLVATAGTPTPTSAGPAGRPTRHRPERPAGLPVRWWGLVTSSTSAGTGLGPRSGSPVQDFGRCSTRSTKPVQAHRGVAPRNPDLHVVDPAGGPGTRAAPRRRRRGCPRHASGPAWWPADTARSSDVGTTRVIKRWPRHLRLRHAERALCS